MAFASSRCSSASHGMLVMVPLHPYWSVVLSSGGLKRECGEECRFASALPSRSTSISGSAASTSLAKTLLVGGGKGETGPPA